MISHNVTEHSHANDQHASNTQYTTRVKGMSLVQSMDDGHSMSFIMLLTILCMVKAKTVKLPRMFMYTRYQPQYH